MCDVDMHPSVLPQNSYSLFFCTLPLLVCPRLPHRLRYLSSLFEEFEGCGSGCSVGLMNGAVSDVQPPQGAKRDSYLVTEQDTSLFFYCFQTAQREIKPSLGNRNRKEDPDTGNSLWILTVYTYIQRCWNILICSCPFHSYARSYFLKMELEKKYVVMYYLRKSGLFFTIHISCSKGCSDSV